MNLLILLPISCILIIAKIFYSADNQNISTKKSFRISFITALVVFALLVNVSTEIGSIFNLVSFYPILFFWIGILVISVVMFWSNILQKIEFAKFSKKNIDHWILLLIVVIAIILGFVAYYVPPNNWDSMTYHMSRVMHWIQNKNVDYYPTLITRQLSSPDLAEFQILHFQILTQNDYFAQSVQWSGMIGSLVVVSLIIKQLGGSVKGQIMGVLFAFTIPMGMLQSITTQNDYIASFYVLVAIYYVLLFKENTSWFNALMIGISIGVAVKTKGTAYVFSAPLVLYLLYFWIKVKEKKVFFQGVIIVILVIVMNLGFYVRNYRLFHDPLASSEATIIVNQKKGLDVTLSNVVRYTAFNLGTNNKELNNKIYKITLGLHRLVSLSPADSATSFGGRPFFIPTGAHLYAEDYSPTPLHLVFFMISLIYWLIFRENFSRLNNLYLAFGTVSFLLFTFYFKWQEWGTRFMLIYFLMMSVFLGVVADKIYSKIGMSKFSFIYYLIPLLFIFNGYTIVLKLVSEPFKDNTNVFKIPRENLYCGNGSKLDKKYKAIAQEFSKINCTEIGIVGNLDDWEYPLWVFLKNTGKPFRIRHLNVPNISNTINKNQVIPCFTAQMTTPH